MEPQSPITPPSAERQHLNIGVFVSGFFVLLFLVTAFTFPINDRLFSRLNSKPESFASGTDYVVFADTTVTIPINYVGDVAATELDFTVDVTGGVLVELQCGGTEFAADQVRSRGSRCLVQHSTGKNSGLIAQAVVTAGPVGTLTVNATGTTRTTDTLVTENSPLANLEYEISAGDVKLGKKVVVPITLDSPNENITAADFIVTVGSATLDDVACGGLSFRDTGVIKDSNRCVVLSQTGQKETTIASAFISTTQKGTATVSANGTISTGNGSTPTDGALVGTVITVVE